METQVTIESASINSKQTRLVLTLVGIAVAIIGSLTLMYGNHNVMVPGLKPQISEVAISSFNLSPKIAIMNVVASVWPF